MSNGTGAFEEWVFGLPGERRYTQDSPVLPEVWLRFGEDPEAELDLLLTPHKDSGAAELMAALSQGDGGTYPGLAYNEGYVVARLHFRQLVREVVPLSPWWAQIWPAPGGHLDAWIEGIEDLAAPPTQPPFRSSPGFRGDWLAWFLALLGWVDRSHEKGTTRRGGRLTQWRRLALRGAELLKGIEPPDPDRETPLWSVSVNRAARTALSRSRLAVKADAAERVFAIGCGELRWAIVDTGVDAAHPAFRHRGVDGQLRPTPDGGPGQSGRVVATYDFTRLRPIVAGEVGGLTKGERTEIEHRVDLGRALDWDALEPLLQVPHDGGYVAPAQDHGTHVAGIVAADWRADDPGMPAEHDLIGICPDIELYDLRVFDANGDSEEFAIAAALQFVRHLNSHSDLQVIHGVNLSLSLDHDLANYAVGRTPICDECERLSASGVVVAVAAGNDGQATFTDNDGSARDGFRTVAITDPGNAEEVITVGSTHRQDPHTYGVSYFSSRGPTGDGRAKPDLVAPGEKIKSPVPDGGYGVKDGTSQATAHVSGVAAMLMARNPELTGQPRRIKQILSASATDLGRERYFQGAGLIDALRALQAV